MKKKKAEKVQKKMIKKENKLKNNKSLNKNLLNVHPQKVMKILLMKLSSILKFYKIAL